MEMLNAHQIQVMTRERRLDLGLSQATLATRANVSRKWISAFERGKASAELPLVLRLLAALELRLDLTPAGPAASKPLSPHPIAPALPMKRLST